MVGERKNVMSVRYGLDEIRASLPRAKNSRSSLWVRSVVRPLSFYVTWLFLRLGITANAASYLSAAVALAGSILLLFPEHSFRLLGAFLLNLWLLLDCVDGNLARLAGESNPSGEFADAIGGYTATGFAYLAVGYAAAITEPVMSTTLLLLGAVTSIANLFSRLVNLKFLQLFGSNDDVGASQSGHGIRGRLVYLAQRSEKELGISGLFMPLLLMSAFLDKYKSLVIGYSIFWGILTIGVVFGRIVQSEASRR